MSRNQSIQANNSNCEVLRGITIRIAWGIATGLFNEEKKQDAMLDAYFDAHQLGLDDYARDVVAVPVLFSDVPDLISAWQAGQCLAAEFEEIAHCPSCRDDAGHPCSSHR
ncbi:hypothetical protein [Achromobacter sp. Marseille-Q4962]|uniref:hypothetical protein n=1 Tax=Achromobacter sp. Marseille-Q4962 TaxID=2942202 RepID=UPI0020735E14|nr:hypothetical protein [Achromobacter sp. Marseille-Q4962]